MWFFLDQRQFFSWRNISEDYWCDFFWTSGSFFWRKISEDFWCELFKGPVATLFSGEIFLRIFDVIFSGPAAVFLEKDFWGFLMWTFQRTSGNIVFWRNISEDFWCELFKGPVATLFSGEIFLRIFDVIFSGPAAVFFGERFLRIFDVNFSKDQWQHCFLEKYFWGFLMWTFQRTSGNIVFWRNISHGFWCDFFWSSCSIFSWRNTSEDVWFDFFWSSCSIFSWRNTSEDVWFDFFWTSGGNFLKSAAEQHK